METLQSIEDNWGKVAVVGIGVIALLHTSVGDALGSEPSTPKKTISGHIHYENGQASCVEVEGKGSYVLRKGKPGESDNLGDIVYAVRTNGGSVTPGTITEISDAFNLANYGKGAAGKAPQNGEYRLSYQGPDRGSQVIRGQDLPLSKVHSCRK